MEKQAHSGAILQLHIQAHFLISYWFVFSACAVLLKFPHFISSFIENNPTKKSASRRAFLWTIAEGLSAKEF